MWGITSYLPFEWPSIKLGQPQSKYNNLGFKLAQNFELTTTRHISVLKKRGQI